jgi:hypothetical protein
MGGSWGISETRGNRGIEVTRKVKRDLLKKSRADILDVEGIRKEIRHSTDDGETKEARTRYNVDLAGESGKQ